VLDGGHLLFYAVQAITRRPLNQKLQEFTFRIGMAMISMLMAFAVINDIWPDVFG
jgi:regulator of sigma E protease